LNDEAEWSSRADSNGHLDLRRVASCPLEDARKDANGADPPDRTAFSRSSGERNHQTCSVGAGWSWRRGSNPLSLAYGASALPSAHHQHGPGREDLNPDAAARMAQRAGFEPTSHRLTAERVALATTSERMAAPGGIAPPSPGSEPGILLLNEGASNGRVGRTRTSAHLRPRQVGYRLLYDPTTLQLG
jgi:hypothetical protein